MFIASALGNAITLALTKAINPSNKNMGNIINVDTQSPLDKNAATGSDMQPSKNIRRKRGNFSKTIIISFSASASAANADAATFPPVKISSQTHWETLSSQHAAAITVM
ncbi:MAG: hypothetical protein J1E60_06270 [Christensenellaceae bacterium]|nr:hypothetical protein [Christensenellaceae bacterium]